MDKLGLIAPAFVPSSVVKDMSTPKGFLTVILVFPPPIFVMFAIS